MVLTYDVMLQIKSREISVGDPTALYRAVLSSSLSHACWPGAVEGRGGCLECEDRATSHPPPLPAVAGMDETKRPRRLQSLSRSDRHTPGRGEIYITTGEGKSASVRTSLQLGASRGSGGPIRDAGCNLLSCPISTHNSRRC